MLCFPFPDRFKWYLIKDLGFTVSLYCWSTSCWQNWWPEPHTRTELNPVVNLVKIPDRAVCCYLVWIPVRARLFPFALTLFCVLLFPLFAHSFKVMTGQTSWHTGQQICTGQKACHPSFICSVRPTASQPDFPTASTSPTLFAKVSAIPLSSYYSI